MSFGATNGFEEGFLEDHTIHWECNNGDKFAAENIRSPHRCPDCGSVLIKEIIEPRVKKWREKPKVRLTPQEAGFLSRI